MFVNSRMRLSPGCDRIYQCWCAHFRFIMGASPQFEMGEQTLVLAKYMCGKAFPPAKIGASGRVPHKARFSIDGYEVTATSNYTFKKAATGGDTLIAESFSSYITSRKSDEAKVKCIDYTTLDQDPGKSASTVERELYSEPLAKEKWYKDLQTASASWIGGREKRTLEELWDIDAEFR
eukprot:GHVU01231510.1.p1 GENE.GHVU01231510.1~~GHVU01231510.1.p1  ORF type:complete len:178 (+),score=14.74 GHVU01231510.1:90-623(+)